MIPIEEEENDRDGNSKVLMEEKVNTLSLNDALHGSQCRSSEGRFEVKITIYLLTLHIFL